MNTHRLSHAAVARKKRIHFLGAPLDPLTMQETLDLAVDAMRTRQRLQHVVVNVAKLVNMRRDESLHRDVVESDLINIDGAGVVWGARLLGHRVPERVAGIDLMLELLRQCHQQNFRPYFFGARQDVLNEAVEQIRRLYPGIQIAGSRNGYFKPEDEVEIVEEIRNSNADCLFVAISSPTKEQFIRRYRDSLGVPFLMGVGGSIDVIAGRVRRAPKWIQSIGCEWLFRVCQEPRRMWKRYLVTNMRYAALLLADVLSSVFGRQSSTLRPPV